MTAIMIFHIRSKYTAVGECSPFLIATMHTDDSTYYREEGNHHVLLPLRDHRTPCYLLGLQRHSYRKRQLSRECIVGGGFWILLT